MKKRTDITPKVLETDSLHHYLRTHITAIISLSNLIKKSGTENQTNHLIDAIHLAADNALAIMDGGVREPAQPCLDGTSLQQCLSDFRTLALGLVHSTSSSFSLTLHDTIKDLPPIILDHAQLHRVLMLLLDNALAYAGPADITLSAKLHSQSQQLQITLCDTGTGFGKEDPEKLFMPYHRGSKVPEKSGSGLGLWSARNIISVMGGTITAQRNSPQGACFQILLPLIPAFSQSDEENAAYADDRSSRKPLADLSVLVVDDNKTNHLILGEMLKAMDIRVHHAVSAEQALQTLEQGIPDLIFMDIRMPDIDGWTLARTIRNDKRWEKIPLIATSSDKAPKSLVLFDGWQQRPIRATDLVSHIRNSV
jgi:CheY-like chemotaxis protein